jgi:hypothetical protein
MTTKDDSFAATGPADTGFFTDDGTKLNTGGMMEGRQLGVLGMSSGIRNLIVPIDRTGVWGRGDRVGVYGQTNFPADTETPDAAIIGTSSQNIAVAAFSDSNTAVYAQSGSGNHRPPMRLGAVTAVSTVNRFAVSGVSSRTEGVRGVSFGSRGVTGFSSANYGVYGLSFAPPGPGTNHADFPAGVYGESLNGSFGVLGVARLHGTAVAGIAPRDGTYAGYFEGNLVVTGQITAGTKDAIVPFPDGSKRLLHCMESPEHWFEDFGSARLTRGRATVKLDVDFAKVVKLNEYRVFLAPEGDCQGLYVRRRGKSFEVHELQGGTSNVAFSYRIVAKRKDIKAHTRFAKIDTRLPIPTGKARAGRGRKAARLPSPKRALLATLAKDARKVPKPPRVGV